MKGDGRPLAGRPSARAHADPSRQLGLFGVDAEAASPMPADAAMSAGAAVATMPDGWCYRPDFIDIDEEAALLVALAGLPLAEARYKAYTAKRRIANFGTAYDFDRNRLLPGPPLPHALLALRERCAAWVGFPAEALSSALVAEYRPGTALGWHRDVPDFEVVVGVSLASACRMRMRRFPPLNPKKADVLALQLAPRSAYVLRGAARWHWQHSIAATPALRYSITFRSPARAGGETARRLPSGS